VYLPDPHPFSAASIPKRFYWFGATTCSLLGIAMGVLGFASPFVKEACSDTQRKYLWFEYIFRLVLGGSQLFLHAGILMPIRFGYLKGCWGMQAKWFLPDKFYQMIFICNFFLAISMVISCIALWIYSNCNYNGVSDTHYRHWAGLVFLDGVTLFIWTTVLASRLLAIVLGKVHNWYGMPYWTGIKKFTEYQSQCPFGLCGTKNDVVPESVSVSQNAIFDKSEKGAKTTDDEASSAAEAEGSAAGSAAGSSA